MALQRLLETALLVMGSAVLLGNRERVMVHEVVVSAWVSRGEDMVLVSMRAVQVPAESEGEAMAVAVREAQQSEQA